MLFRVLQQQLIPLCLEPRDLTVDRAAFGGTHQAVGGFLTCELPLEFVPARLHLGIGLPQQLQVVALLLQSGVRAAVRTWHHADVLLLELRKPVLCVDELLLVLLDLGFQETLRYGAVAALEAQAVFHERIEQRPDHAMGNPGVVVLEGHLKSVARGRPTGASKLDTLRQRIDYGFLLLPGFGLQHQVGFLRHLFQIRPAQHDGLHHADLAHDVAVDGETRQQRTQQGLRVDIHLRAGRVLVRDELDRDPACSRDDPGDDHALPAVAPGAAQEVQGLCDDVLHLCLRIDSRG